MATLATFPSSWCVGYKVALRRKNPPAPCLLLFSLTLSTLRLISLNLTLSTLRLLSLGLTLSISLLNMDSNPPRPDFICGPLCVFDGSPRVGAKPVPPIPQGKSSTPRRNFSRLSNYRYLFLPCATENWRSARGGSSAPWCGLYTIATRPYPSWNAQDSRCTAFLTSTSILRASHRGAPGCPRFSFSYSPPPCIQPIRTVSSMLIHRFSVPY